MHTTTTNWKAQLIQGSTKALVGAFFRESLGSTAESYVFCGPKRTRHKANLRKTIAPTRLNLPKATEE